MASEAALGGAGAAVQAFLDGVWNDANRAVLVSVLGGIFLYFVRSWADSRRMARSLARALHFELEENQRELMSTRLSGVQQAGPMRIDGVYRGLLASGNIRHLHRHQEMLHRPYSMKSAGDPGLPSALEGAIVSIGEAACPSMRGRISAVRRALCGAFRR